MRRRRRSLSRRMRALAVLYAYAYRSRELAIFWHADKRDERYFGVLERITTGFAHAPPNPPYGST